MGWSTAAGFFACLICSIFFGSMFVPVKKYPTGDGIFVQWIMGCAIMFVGIFIGSYDAYKTFYPLSMFGGFLWATGNVTAIPIINRIGMTVGILLWSFTGLVAGWASGRFGWFGLKEQVPSNPVLNYLGLILSLISTLMFAVVKSTPRKDAEESQDLERSEEDDDLLNIVNSSNNNSNDDIVHSSSQFLTRLPLFHNVSSNNRTNSAPRIAALIAATIAGVLYGLCFAPVIYIQDNIPDAPVEALSYFMAFACGIFLTSTAYFLIYAVYNRNCLKIDSRLILPSFLAGVFWAIAQASFFVANEALSEAVTFPIISRFPGVVAALWDVFKFQEIKGRRNLSMLGAAMVVTVIGGVLSGLSKIV